MKVILLCPVLVLIECDHEREAYVKGRSVSNLQKVLKYKLLLFFLYRSFYLLLSLTFYTWFLLYAHTTLFGS